jgi:hypothetical protein
MPGILQPYNAGSRNSRLKCRRLLFLHLVALFGGCQRGRVVRSLDGFQGIDRKSWSEDLGIPL